jgi:hypothetical protein
MISARGLPTVAGRTRPLGVPTLGGIGAAVALTGFLLLVGRAIQDPSRIRPAVAIVAVIFLVGVATRSPVAAFLGVFVWLIALGMTRRLVSEAATITNTDPLLLVSPFLLVLLTGAAARVGAFRGRTTLANGVLVLCLLSLLGAVNPLQGSLTAGVAGLLFILVPMLAFWIGRALFDDRTLALVLTVTGAAGIGVGLYGLAQTYLGFPAWDKHWITDVHSSYSALTVNGVIRPFATFNSASEYGTFLALAIVVWLAVGRRAGMLPVTLAALAILVPALVLESARGAVVELIAGLGLLIGARSRLPFVMSLGIGLLLLVGLAFGLRHYGPAASGRDTTSSLVRHQVTGLSDPLSPETSTFGSHVTELQSGVKRAFTQPFGEGIGAVTIAGGKFGGLNHGTESDPSNMGVALGLPGLIAYLVVLVAGLRRAYSLASGRHDGLALAALGVLAVTAGQWLNGGQYAVAVLPWLVLGWVDRSHGGARLPADEAVA